MINSPRVLAVVLVLAVAASATPSAAGNDEPPIALYLSRGLDTFNASEINDFIAETEAVFAAGGIPVSFDRIDIGSTFSVGVLVDATEHLSAGVRFTRAKGTATHEYRDRTGEYSREYSLTSIGAGVVVEARPTTALPLALQVEIGFGSRRVKDVVFARDDIRSESIFLQVESRSESGRTRAVFIQYHASTSPRVGLLLRAGYRVRPHPEVNFNGFSVEAGVRFGRVRR